MNTRFNTCPQRRRFTQCCGPSHYPTQKRLLAYAKQLTHEETQALDLLSTTCIKVLENPPKTSSRSCWGYFTTTMRHAWFATYGITGASRSLILMALTKTGALAFGSGGKQLANRCSGDAHSLRR